MMKEKTCRYGHGSLSRLPHVWGIPSYSLDRGMADMFKADDVAYTVNILRCETCGYIELEDYDVTPKK